MLVKESESILSRLLSMDRALQQFLHIGYRASYGVLSVVRQSSCTLLSKPRALIALEARPPGQGGALSPGSPEFSGFRRLPAGH